MSRSTCGPAVPLPACAPPAIYVHIPFCSHICPYCDFNTYAGQDDLIPDYVEAAVQEMATTASMVTPTGPALSLFIGGGTPSLLPAAGVERIIAAARQHLSLAGDAEITMEANPESVDREYLEAVRSAGVNRLSLGVQSQRRAGLRVLGRGHKSLEAGAAFEAARRAGFNNISLDFIFGWPGQRAGDWDQDIETILEWQPEHVSLYSLIVEPGTPMEVAVRQGILAVVDDDTVADFYLQAEATLGGAGWEHYEIANWARESGYRSVHNQYYWQNGSYYGIGAGAHSYLNGLRGSNILLPAAYIDAVQQGRRPLAWAEEVDTRTAMAETMMLGLRLLVDGVSAREFRQRHGEDLEEVYGNALRRFTALGLLEQIDDRWRLTPNGALVSNSILAEFLD